MKETVEKDPEKSDSRAQSGPEMKGMETNSEEERNGDSDDEEKTEETEDNDSEEGEDEDTCGRWYCSTQWHVTAGRGSNFNLRAYSTTQGLLNTVLSVIIAETRGDTLVEYAAVDVNEVESNRGKICGTIHLFSKEVEVDSSLIGERRDVDEGFKADISELITALKHKID